MEVSKFLKLENEMFDTLLSRDAIRLFRHHSSRNDVDDDVSSAVTLFFAHLALTQNAMLLSAVVLLIASYPRRALYCYTLR